MNRKEIFNADAETLLADGLLHFLQQSENVVEDAKPRFIKAMKDWIQRFGEPETFISLNPALQQDILFHIIFEARRKNWLAQQAQIELTKRFNRTPSLIADALCLQLNNQARVFKLSDEKNELRLRSHILFRLRIATSAEIAIFEKVTGISAKHFKQRTHVKSSNIIRREKILDHIKRKETAEIKVLAQCDEVLALNFLAHHDNRDDANKICLCLKILLLLKDPLAASERFQLPLDVIAQYQLQAFQFLSLCKEKNIFPNFAQFALDLANDAAISTLSNDQLQVDFIIIAALIEKIQKNENNAESLLKFFSDNVKIESAFVLGDDDVLAETLKKLRENRQAVVVSSADEKPLCHSEREVCHSERVACHSERSEESFRKYRRI